MLPFPVKKLTWRWCGCVKINYNNVLQILLSVSGNYFWSFGGFRASGTVLFVSGFCQLGRYLEFHYIIFTDSVLVDIQNFTSSRDSGDAGALSAWLVLNTTPFVLDYKIFCFFLDS
uniref:Uncharacterized protein n=1 Tax=Oryza brachyantha TaxID=4533 RepID=J3NA67_ORYBR